jgi:hypothetical protein
MAKRLKKVKTTKEPQKGPFTKPDAPAELQPAVFAAPPEPSAWAKKVDGIKEAIRAKHAAQKAEFGLPRPLPMNPSDITSETIVAGKSVEAWDKEIADFAQKATGPILDMTGFPEWVIWSVDKWHAHGRKTASTKVLAEITDLREKAEELIKFAALDRDKAKNQSPAKAKKLLEAADKKTVKAEKLLEQANELAKEHKKK